MVDPQRGLQGLIGHPPGLFGVALEPQCSRHQGQDRYLLVVLHAEALGEMATPCVPGQVDQRLFGKAPRQRLIAGKMLSQPLQADRARRQLGRAEATQFVEVPGLCQGLPIVAAAQVDGHESGYGFEFGAEVVASFCQLPSHDEGGNRRGFTALRVVPGIALDKPERQLELRAGRRLALQHCQGLAHITFMFLQQG